MDKCVICGNEINNLELCVSCGYWQEQCTCDPKQYLWQLLVPTVRNSDGKPYTVRYHKIFDQKVIEICGGITILRPAYGKWVYESELFSERMIPVVIAATREQMQTIATFAKKHYDQIAIFYYLMSQEVYIV